MKKAIIIGSPGSGKSTFSRKLRDKTGLPLHYLDMIYHLPDKTTVSRDIFDAALDDIFENDSWIIDGNYKRTLERRIVHSDTVFLFDLPPQICIQGARERIGVKREDMPWVETELREDLAQYIISFADEQLPKIYELLEKYRDGRNIIIFKSREEADKYLNTL